MKFKNVTVTYIHGKNPELIVYDDFEKELTRYDLRNYATAFAIRELLKQYFDLRNEDDCTDSNLYCEDWAREGECEKNKLYMRLSCKYSCGECRSGKNEL